MSTKGLVLRLQRTEEQLQTLKILSSCYEFENIDDYLHYVLDRGVAADVELFNRAAAEHNARLAANQEGTANADASAVSASAEEPKDETRS